MPFKDSSEGTTHHDKDACFKCKICGDHFFIESKAKACNHDYSMVPQNAQRTGDEGRVESVTTSYLPTPPVNTYGSTEPHKNTEIVKDANKPTEEGDKICMYPVHPRMGWSCGEKVPCKSHYGWRDSLDNLITTVTASSQPEDWESVLMEKLADVEHQRWADWQKYVHSKLFPVESNLCLPLYLIGRWNEQIITPYSKLSEKEKESDRDQVRRYFHLIKEEKEKSYLQGFTDATEEHTKMCRSPRQETISEILGIVEGMKLGEEDFMPRLNSSDYYGFNLALSDLLSKLKELK